MFGAKGAPPLKALADLKGKTLRIGNPEQGDLAKALGAIPVTLPTPDVSPALQRGAVQYVITAAAAGGRLWRDFFASGIMDQIFVATSYVAINKKRWDALSPAEQAAIQKNVDEMTAWITKSQEDDDGVAIKEFAEKDKWTIVPKSAAVQAEIVKVMEPIWKKWARRTADPKRSRRSAPSARPSATRCRLHRGPRGLARAASPATPAERGARVRILNRILDWLVKACAVLACADARRHDRADLRRGRAALLLQRDARTSPTSTRATWSSRCCALGVAYCREKNALLTVDFLIERLRPARALEGDLRLRPRLAGLLHPARLLRHPPRRPDRSSAA